MIKLLWHENSNYLAIAEISRGNPTVLTILDDEFDGENPFNAYPFIFLKSFGWIDLGGLI